MRFVIILLFFVNIFSNIVAQDKKPENCTLRLQMHNGNRIEDAVLRVGGQEYITDKEGLVKFPNFKRENLAFIRDNVVLVGYTGEPLSKKIRQGVNLVITLPKGSKLPPTHNELLAIQRAKEESEKVNKMSDAINHLGQDLDSIKKAKENIEKAQKLEQEAHLATQKKANEDKIKADEKQKRDNEKAQILIGIIIFITLAIAICGYMMYLVWKKNEQLTKQKKEIEYKNDKIEELLLNILPKEVADELSLKGVTETRYYDFTTVLFADIKGFSALAQKVTPQVLISELDSTFGKFDDIIKKYHIERIKTIGDCYMCAGGVPNRNRSNPIDVVLAAIEIQKWMLEEKEKRNGDFWQVRLGLHTGDLVAGVVGKTKFAFDIWGSTVNLASRMESVGEIGRVNISEATYQQIKDFFDCTPRGKIHVKNIGEVDSYFIDRIKLQLSADSEGIIPNQDFWTIKKQKFRE
ncbi:MAG: hypothetical protein EAZ20_01725 [Bacteroidetes bacterium]|nr:MAG: hypothetical protein EAZ20_01725 [Bacteroidota bacterium]